MVNKRLVKKSILAIVPFQFGGIERSSVEKSERFKLVTELLLPPRPRTRCRRTGGKAKRTNYVPLRCIVKVGNEQILANLLTFKALNYYPRYPDRQHIDLIYSKRGMPCVLCGGGCTHSVLINQSYKNTYRVNVLCAKKL